MLIVDTRINAKFCVQLKAPIDINIIDYWLSPFFTTQEENGDILEVIAKIEVIPKLNGDYIFRGNVFYINADVPISRVLYTIMSILRTLFKYMALMLGYKNLHAGCLAYKENGVLLVAERNQGKTTIILNALQDGDYSLLANDQIMYNACNDNVLGYPAAIGIRNNSCYKQDLLHEKALWFIDDPFLNWPKPIVHIKDLSLIYQSELIAQSKAKILINYEKSQHEKELAISDSGQAIPFEKITLPIEKVYNSYLLECCFNSILYYINDFIKISNEENGNDNILCINVKCGLLRIKDFLSIIKSFI